MGKLFIFYAFIILSIGLLTLDRIWFDLVPAELFFKIITTLVIIGGAVFAVDMLKREIKSEKELKKDKFVD